MYRIRFHGRGGQGIKTSSRILGTAFFHEGYEVQDAPVYGAERRGAPLHATVRAARTPIHERGAVNHPDLVIVADEGLMPIPAANVLLGVSARTVLLLNSAISAGEWRARLNLAGPIVALPVSAEVESRAELPYVGAMCAGAAARLVGCIRREALTQAIGDELRELGADVIARNREHALNAFAAMQAQAGIVKEGGEIKASDYTRPDWIDVPFEQARRSAPDIHAAATSVQIKTGAWRTMRPVIDDARCTRCTWVCSTMCPDSAIRVETGRPVIDYDHCKGCLVCVAVCPPHAIRAVPESEFAEVTP
jgi:pyruvate ferredoxin oxidoreductase gamma subunit